MKPADTAPYLTYVLDRNPPKKPHLTLGEARKAILFRVQNGVLTVPCMVYKWSDTKGWDRMWKLEAGTRKEDLPWM